MNAIWRSARLLVAYFSCWDLCLLFVENFMILQGSSTIQHSFSKWNLLKYNWASKYSQLRIEVNFNTWRTKVENSSVTNVILIHTIILKVLSVCGETLDIFENHSILNQKTYANDGMIHVVNMLLLRNVCHVVHLVSWDETTDVDVMVVNTFSVTCKTIFLLFMAFFC